MPVTLINGFILLPHPADWTTPPEWQRVWETGIAAALTGAEQRQAMRIAPRTQLGYTISALGIEERARLDERLDAATKSGLACAPFWGRGSSIVTLVGAVLTLSDALWPWAMGDYVFLQQPNDAVNGYQNFEAKQVTAIAGAQLTVNGAPAGNYPVGSLVWPMLFGKFTSDKASVDTSWHNEVKVTIAELQAPHQGAVGNVPGPGGPGIGGWAVGSTLEVQ